jgi:hypothetical protein
VESLPQDVSILLQGRSWYASAEHSMSRIDHGLPDSARLFHKIKKFF